MAAARWTSPSLTSGKSEKFEHTKLDETNESLSLLSILRAFDSPVTEERAWAILYQSAKTGLQCFTSANHAASSHHNNTTTTTNSTNNIHNLTDNSDQVVMKCAVVSETSHLWIHRDGHVHPHSFQVAADSIEAERRTVAECQSQLVSGLGWALYEALDYGCKQEEQNVLSPDLEQMIDFLTSADTGECQSAEDEGIEQDSGEVEESAATANVSVETTSNTSTSSAAAAAAAAAATMTSLSHVMDRCRMQISSTASSNQADAHFRAVCRALVAETLEFSDFLVKVSSAPEDWRELRNNKSETHSQELTELHLADWARLWVQVIRQLRNGVKLKSASGGESARKPYEYELTPYEMMMDDIRSRRYKLRQVMVDGTIPPRVKKDAHAVILEFIRSRPPLRKASERKLRPLARRVSTPVELLMESIRQHDSKELRPTRCLLVNRTENVTATISTTTKRKLLKADHLHDELDEDEDLELPPPSPPRRYDYVVDPFSSCSRSESSTPLNCKMDARNRDHNGIPLNRERDESPSRRHSLTVLPPPLTRTTSNPFLKRQSLNAHLNAHVRKGADPRMMLNPANLSSDQPGSLPCSGPSSSTSSSSASLHSPPGSPTSAGHLQEDFVRSKEFQQVVQGKLVTLEELVHMRRVLTAASLDNLPLDSSIKDDVTNGKVCFVCRKTRFSVFGSWWHNCKLCRRTVCTKCCIKMRIPSDQFDTVDVSEVSWYGVNADKLEQSSPVVSSSSLFSSFQLKLPQFRIRSPNGGLTDGCESSESTPTSPVLNRRGSERRKQTLAQPPQKFLHQALSRHQSLSTNNTPARKPVSAQASVAPSHPQANKRSSSSGSDCYVCRDCQTLIENIIYNPVHTVTHCERTSIHVSLP